MYEKRYFVYVFFGMFGVMLLLLETCSEKSYCLDGT